MDIKNTVSYIGDGVQIASVRNAEKPEQSFSVEKNLDGNLVKNIADGQGISSPPAERVDVEKALSDVNQFFQNERRTLSFSLNEKTKDVVIEVKDAETNEVIRQIPPEFVVKLAERLTELSGMAETSGGFLLKDKA